MWNKILIYVLAVAVMWLYLCKFLERSPDLINAEIAVTALPGIQESVESMQNQLDSQRRLKDSQSDRLDTLQGRFNDIEVRLDRIEDRIIPARRSPDPITEPLFNQPERPSETLDESE